MIYIVRQSDVRNSKFAEDPCQRTWYLGTRKPRLPDGNCFDDVCEVYADSHELESIRRRCINIPDIPSSGSMVWKGPFAQFVYDSIVYEPAQILPPRPTKK